MYWIENWSTLPLQPGLGNLFIRLFPSRCLLKNCCRLYQIFLLKIVFMMKTSKSTWETFSSVASTSLWGLKWSFHPTNTSRTDFTQVLEVPFPHIWGLKYEQHCFKQRMSNQPFQADYWHCTVYKFLKEDIKIQLQMWLCEAAAPGPSTRLCPVIFIIT